MSKATIDDLIESGATKTVLLPSIGKEVTIKKLKYKDLIHIGKLSKGNEYDMAKYMIVASLVEPKLGPEQVDQLKVSVVMDLATLIAEFSGTTREALEAARNL